jgi:hypothetical protein
LDSEIARAERTLGREFPAALRGIYRASDGISVLGGNLNFHPLWPRGKKLGLTEASDRLREWDWPVPDELVVFGDNGSDEVFGLWLPVGADTSSQHPVIEVAEVFDKPEALAVVGTDLCRFLRAWTAFYTLMYVRKGKVERTALDVLGVPEELRAQVDEDTQFRRLFAWSDPNLPDPRPDPYKRGRTAEGLRAAYGANTRK